MAVDRKHTAENDDFKVVDSRQKPFVDIDARVVDEWMPVMTTDALAFYIAMARMEDLGEDLTLARIAERTGMDEGRAFIAQGMLVGADLLDIEVDDNGNETWNWGVPAGRAAVRL